MLTTLFVYPAYFTSMNWISRYHSLQGKGKKLVCSFGMVWAKYRKPWNCCMRRCPIHWEADPAGKEMNRETSAIGFLSLSLHDPGVMYNKCPGRPDMKVRRKDCYGSIIWILKAGEEQEGSGPCLCELVRDFLSHFQAAVSSGTPEDGCHQNRIDLSTD